MHFKLPSPALVVASLALFVSLGGSAIAAAPIVQRAVFANNAGKLQGRTAAQVAAVPGPASTAASLVSTETVRATMGPHSEREVRISCPRGKVVSGGFGSDGPVFSFDSRPVNATTWELYLVNPDETSSAEVVAHAVCVR